MQATKKKPETEPVPSAQENKPAEKKKQSLRSKMFDVALILCALA